MRPLSYENDCKVWPTLPYIPFLSKLVYNHLQRILTLSMSYVFLHTIDKSREIKYTLNLDY